MLDAPARRLLAPSLDAAAGALARTGVHPLVVTGVGWLLGVGACAAAATEQWGTALLLWLANRLADGLDGPLARRTAPTDLGGFLDLLADFSVYAGFVLAVAVARPEARLACVALLVAYYLSGTAFLLLAPRLEERGARGDGRSVVFVGGLAEGTETVLAYVAFCLLPDRAAVVAWVFAAMVAVTVVQRTAEGIRVLRPPRTPPRTPTAPDPTTTQESP